jgi:hypothetical protein
MPPPYRHPRRWQPDPGTVQPHGVPAAAPGEAAVSPRKAAEIPPLTPKARRLIRELQDARKQLVTARAGGGERPSLAGDRAAARRKLAGHEQQVKRCWERLAELGFSSEDVGHHILKEGIF